MKNGDVTTNKDEEQEEAGFLKIWWLKRSKLEKRLIIAAIVFVMFLPLIGIIYAIVFNEPEVCTSSICVRTSMELLNYVDVNVDPCEDFYRFSCGNFLQNTNLDNRTSRSIRDIMIEEIQTQIRNMLEESSILMTTTTLVKKNTLTHSGGNILGTSINSDTRGFRLAKEFYRACMNVTAIESDGLKRIKQLFEKIGGWPILKGNNWRETQFDWKEAVYKLRQNGINFEQFLILSVQRDKTDPTRYALNLEIPQFDPTETSVDYFKEKYLEYMVDVAVIFGANKERARNEQRQVIQFLSKLAKISGEEFALLSNGTKKEIYNPLSLSELQHGFPGVPWLGYINTILTPATDISYDDVIFVPESYLKNLLSLLKATPKRVLANFMVWHTLRPLINYLPSRILDRTYHYLETVKKGRTREPRWKMCVESTKDRLDSPISAAYIKRYFDDNTRLQAISILRNIKYQFKENLRKLSWMDEKTKEIAIEKLVSSVEDIATYNNLLLVENRFYDEVEIVEDQFLVNVLRLDFMNTNVEFAKLRHRIRGEEIFNEPGFVTGLNIKYSPKDNVLRVPIGIFQGLFYQKDRPEYMNYGALGTLIAHEIYHIIVEAEYKDLQGDLRSWWSSHTLLNYEENLQCLSSNYGKSISLIQNDQDRLNNSMNLRDEAMAHLVGMKLAYDTYTNWVEENGVEPEILGLDYTPNQLFWISSAIHHCTKYSTVGTQTYIAHYQSNPAQLRINGPMRNLEEFSLDFACPIGAPMNPEYKCHVS